MTVKRALPTKRLPVRSLTDQADLHPEATHKRMEACRLRIKTSLIIDRMQGHVFGKAKMTPTQLVAAQALLRKTLPDLVQAKTEINFAPVIFNFKMDTPALEAQDAVEVESDAT